MLDFRNFSYIWGNKTYIRMENKGNELRKLDNSDFIPEYFYLLPEAKQNEYIQRKLDNEIDLDRTKQEKVLQSKVAEHDMSVAQAHIQALDSNRKFYTVTQKFEMGSGKVEVSIRGGDTKFIVPIVVSVGAIIMGILFLL
jgi:hypothetical protein